MSYKCIAKFLLKDVNMDTLTIALDDSNLLSRRDIAVGPQKIRCITYGVSLVLPREWIAASVAGELYGIEPLSRKNGRICVLARVAGVRDIIMSYTNVIDMGFVRLIPASTPFVDGDQISVHGLAQVASPHKHAFITTTVTPKNNAITFAALFDESAALLFRGAVNELADSVRDLAA